MIITKRLEWDMGHRIPNHKSVCRNLHGHRYVVEVALEGEIQTSSGQSNEGMVLDFGDIKQLMMKHIHERCDHSFMYSQKDPTMVEFFQKNPDFKSVKVDFIPTAENIAQWIFRQLEAPLRKTYGQQLRLKSVQVWETPSSSAVISST